MDGAQQAKKKTRGTGKNYPPILNRFLIPPIISSMMMVYKEGMMNRVSKVAQAKPKKMVLAMGAQISDLPPRPIIMGKTPDMVVIEVRMIALNRRRPDWTIDLQRLTPLALALLMKVTMTMASFTAIPAMPTIP